jgi:acyl-CoA reductase-like NAD-dependent aldehyde dehydrogenase
LQRDSDGVNAVTFTGSVPVGGKVAQRATPQIKKCVLELGGSDLFIVCKDQYIFYYNTQYYQCQANRLFH